MYQAVDEWKQRLPSVPVLKQRKKKRKDIDHATKKDRKKKTKNDALRRTETSNAGKRK